MSEDEIIFDGPEGENQSLALKKLRQKLKKCVAEKQEYLLGWQRAKADFVNFKKDQEDRKTELRKFAKEDLIENLLPVLDSFQMAILNGSKDGVGEIYSQFLGILKKEGLKEVNPVGEDFDPSSHEAIEMVDGKDGKVMEVVQQGYVLNGKIIRAARVKVGR